ncbi:MAG: SPASM domain-containing protein [Acidimicrobiales bacterium]
MQESRYNVWVEDGGRTFLFNSLSGALLEVPRGTRASLARVLSDSSATGCSPALLERMAYGRMLVPDDADELAVLAGRYRASRDDTGHFAYTLVTSLGCNFDCGYCFEDKRPSIMSAAVQDAVVAVLEERLPALRTMSVTWFGGEPLIGKRALLALSDRFIAACDAFDVHYDAMIVTNGSLLDEATCAALRDRRVTTAQVTLDGPPATHDRMRPVAGGRPSFERIVANLRHAVEHLDVMVRMNVDADNAGLGEELLDHLDAAGLTGRLGVYVGQIVGVDDGAGAPSSTYGTRCLTGAEFADTELGFADAAADRSYGALRLPQPIGAPCTAVRRNEYVVGSEGELYKCWDSVGNPREVVGSIFDEAAAAAHPRQRRWLGYDPFTDDECTSCVALPVCMGGCAHHGLDLVQRANRCGTTRHTLVDQVRSFARTAS